MVSLVASLSPRGRRRDEPERDVPLAEKRAREGCLPMQSDPIRGHHVPLMSEIDMLTVQDIGKQSRLAVGLTLGFLHVPGLLNLLMFGPPFDFDPPHQMGFIIDSAFLKD
ncbi:hypothetical protein CRG98_014997 [Punica granatum]|uniref:Uncharacterized protein n=1 Tax=Punica granatum TaxID=22663 RepID=A0A2I0K7N4_PUNGR|nr:hypothetical protein CRG98_014997 [Punica granatum]